MKKTIDETVVLATLVIITIGCGQDAPEYVPPVYETPTLVEPDYTTTEWSGLSDLSVGEEEFYLSIEGYVGLYDKMFYTSGGSMSFDLFQRRNQIEGYSIDVSGSTGNGINHIQELPASYTQYSLKIVCADSTIAQPGSYVRIYGSLKRVDSTGVAISMNKVEKVAKDWTDSYLSSAVELTQAIVTDTLQDDVYTYMDGKLALTDAFLSTNGRVTLDFRQSNNKMVKNVSLKLGSTGPSTVNSPPDYYSSDDLEYRDCYKTTLGPSDKVRVYGTWSRNYDNTGGYFNVEEIVKL